MPTIPDVLLVDSGQMTMPTLASRLRRMLFRAVVAKTPEEAHQLLVDPRYAIAAAVISPDLPTASLSGALDAMRALSPEHRLRFLATGDRPSREVRRGLRDAGVNFAIWDPIDAHALRFQINRALADPRRRGPLRRQAMRVPAIWNVRVARRSRVSDARVYSLSSEGCFLATERPAVRHTELRVWLPLPDGEVCATGRVVMTNVPGNLQSRRLPHGMAIRFSRRDLATDERIHRFVDARAKDLEV